MIVLRLEKDLRRAIRRGHPWIFDRALGAPERPLSPGEVVSVADRRRKLAVGYADPSSPIRVRVLATDPGLRPGEAWARARAESAGRLRRSVPSLREAQALRAIHGEGDGMPGLVVDLYRETAVAVFDGAGARAFWEPRIGAVAEGLRASGLELARVYNREAGPLLGGEPPEEIRFREGAASFAASVRHGQKTGWFLDQRENRARVGELSRGAAVLDLFSYAGGFAVHAALGGARRVTVVDAAAPAIEAARENLEASGSDPEAHELCAVDVFSFLDKAARSGRRWDLVVCDPPSFAPSEQAKKRALGAYRRLNAAALAVTAPGGVFCTASCSSHVTEEDLLGVVAEAGDRAGRRLRLLETRGAAPDHPVRPGFPEGRYLSFLILHVE